MTATNNFLRRQVEKQLQQHKHARLEHAYLIRF